MAKANPIDFGKTKITLSTGLEMPAVGIGTYRVKNHEDMHLLVDTALATGYRLFDTASGYNNEHILGNALQTLLPKYDLEREDIFITTKLAPAHHGIDAVPKAFHKSLENLGLEYIDMYLIHFPGAAKIPSHSPKNKILRSESWKAMAKLYDEGKMNAIGVCNYTVNHLNEFLSIHSNVPVVNQVEWHPHYHQPELLNFCKGNSIVIQAYCSFGGASVGTMDLLKHPIVKEIADNYGVSAAQILLVWSLQQDIAVIPIATNLKHINENIQLDFRLTSEEIKVLSNFKQEKKFAWDPRLVG